MQMEKVLILKDLIGIVPEYSSVYSTEYIKENGIGTLSLIMTYGNSEDILSKEVISVFPEFNEEISYIKQIVVIKW